MNSQRVDNRFIYKHSMSCYATLKSLRSKQPVVWLMLSSVSLRCPHVLAKHCLDCCMRSIRCLPQCATHASCHPCLRQDATLLGSQTHMSAACQTATCPEFLPIAHPSAPAIPIYRTSDITQRPLMHKITPCTPSETRASALHHDTMGTLNSVAYLACMALCTAEKLWKGLTDPNRPCTGPTNSMFTSVNAYAFAFEHTATSAATSECADCTTWLYARATDA